jgi:pyridoxal phosphate enzyme (YggS family)
MIDPPTDPGVTPAASSGTAPTAPESTHAEQTVLQPIAAVPVPMPVRGGQIEPEEVVRRAEVLRERIEGAGGDPDAVRIVAVTKRFGPEAVAAARAAGLDDLGENYAQELLTKAVVPEAAGCRWHFIGPVQRNKVRALAPVVHLWQGVDRVEVGVAIARQAPGARVLVQVNVTDEPTKAGVSPADAPGLVNELRSLGLDVRGLMAIGRTGAPRDARAGFADLSALADRLELEERSMGMSGDLEVAVQEGSTMIRIGTALFGPRPEVEQVRR